MLDYCIKDIFSLEARLKFDAILQHQVNLSNRFPEDVPFSILIVAVDKFNTYSTVEAESIMKNVGQYLIDNSRKSDVVCKLSHNKFIIMTPHSSETESFEFAKKLEFNLDSNVYENDGSFSISIAISEYNDVNETKEQFITRVNSLVNSIVDSGSIVTANL
jgi:diguanylate cyclase (GGDEF)-like protein